jgi:hypothetical protein
MYSGLFSAESSSYPLYSLDFLLLKLARNMPAVRNQRIVSRKVEKSFCISGGYVIFCFFAIDTWGARWQAGFPLGATETDKNCQTRKLEEMLMNTSRMCL